MTAADTVDTGCRSRAQISARRPPPVPYQMELVAGLVRGVRFTTSCRHRPIANASHTLETTRTRRLAPLFAAQLCLAPLSLHPRSRPSMPRGARNLRLRLQRHLLGGRLGLVVRHDLVHDLLFHRRLVHLGLILGLTRLAVLDGGADERLEDRVRIVGL